MMSVILEDNPYRDLRYTGKALPTIKSLDTEGRVIYLGSFSKILSPSLHGLVGRCAQSFKELLALKAAVIWNPAIW